MRFPLAVSAAAIVAVAVAACTGGQPSTYIAPPPAAAPTGALVLSQSAQPQSAGTAGGVTGTLTYVGGTGSVTSASSATAPAGTTTVTPAGRVRVEAVSATSPNVYYVTISSAAGATLNGLPSIALQLATAAIGTYQEAQFGGGKWTNVSGATATVNSAGTAVEFPPGQTAVTIPAGGSIFLAFYQGNFPQPTPAGQLANNVLSDPGFESGSAAAFGSPITASGWTVCSFNASVPNAPAPNRAFSTFTPQPVGGANPGPAAAIKAKGTAVPQGTSTATPLPTQFTVPVNSGNDAAVLGGVFSNQQFEDFRYNGLCQQVTVPANNPGISMQLWANGNDGSKFFNFEVDALNTSGQFLGNIYEDPNPIGSPNPGSPGDSAYRAVTVPASSLTPYAGQTIDLFVGVWIDGGSSSGSTSFGSYYFVDDFNLTGTP